MLYNYTALQEFCEKNNLAYKEVSAYMNLNI